MTGKIVKRKDFAGKLDLEEQVKLDQAYELGVHHSQKRIIRKEVYSAKEEGQKIIEEASQEAQRIKQEAQELMKRVESKMDQIKKEGFEKGRDEGCREVTELLVAAKHAQDEMFKGIEKDIINLVYDISEKIIGRELNERETTIVDLIRQALHATAGQQIVVLVNPIDFDVVKKNQPLLLQTLDVSKTIQIRTDDKVKPKGCLIETEIGTIDAQLETQLAAVRKALGIEPEVTKGPQVNKDDEEDLEPDIQGEEEDL